MKYMGIEVNTILIIAFVKTVQMYNKKEADVMTRGILVSKKIIVI